MLEDESGAIPIVGGFAGAPIALGRRARLEGACTGQRYGLGMAITQALVVDNDGLHSPESKSGSVWLRAGLNPVRMVWFNSLGGGVLNVSYEGPGLSRQAIPWSMTIISRHQ